MNNNDAIIQARKVGDALNTIGKIEASIHLMELKENESIATVSEEELRLKVETAVGYAMRFNRFILEELLINATESAKALIDTQSEELKKLLK